MGNAAKTIKQLRKAVNLQIRRLALEVQANLVSTPPLGTPRDTSHAAANWVPQLDSPYRGVGGKGADRAAQVAGMARLLSAKKLLGHIVWISNNVHYITLLNRGTSKQSPRNFVPIAIRTAFRSVGQRS